MSKYIAHITLEAQTPLKIGSNTSDVLQDSPIQKDFNSLPMILGTSITGVLRKEFGGNVDDIFGLDNGSKVIISNALLLDENSKVHEKLMFKKSDFLQLFNILPIREHVAINDKGVAKEHSKFDEEVLYAGSRFKFSIELEHDRENFEAILNLLGSNSFRLGGGATKGFGKVNIVKIKTQKFDQNDYEQYENSLNYELKNSYEFKISQDTKYTSYLLKIKPDDFFIFGSGFGDKDADSTPVYEQIIDYENAKLSKKQILIPASSIKGAIAHRTTYHYNLQNKLFIGNTKAKKSIKAIFGEAKNSNENIDGSKGKILISDCFKEIKKDATKTFDHVSIDRFTGGAIVGALFQEKTIAQKDMWDIEILLEKGIDDKYIKAFEATLDDIKNGMLSLGGMTTKGHGVFNGIWSKDEK